MVTLIPMIMLYFTYFLVQYACLAILKFLCHIDAVNSCIEINFVPINGAWWWSSGQLACHSALTIRIQIPQFFIEFLFEKTKILEKEAGFGTFKNVFT